MVHTKTIPVCYIHTCSVYCDVVCPYFLYSHTHLMFGLLRCLPLQRRRPASVYRPLVDLTTLEERHIIMTYRLDRATITEVCQQLDPDLIPAICSTTAMPPAVQVLSVLHFLPSGSFQAIVGLAAGMSQPMFSNVLRRVLAALLKHMSSYSSFPQSEDLPTVKAGFFAMGHIPHVIGVIDGSYIALVPIRTNEQVYRNRKSNHSINVQMVCLADQYISYVTAKLSGSVHNAYALRNSSVPQVMA
ncbi:hypothetical protein NDU88_006784 [Pleurodeles waltl]|uniref:DDE Tnp4 domain-containing protein n=1 Tax=Pleurodeles waltl TaxID=8319 RepID=A0AAV7RQG0_PLEWA|nr:hypothetical protein NDU88_006784 [Pleurodeles waltl]